MKNILNISLASIAFFAAFSCSDIDDDRVSISPGSSPVLNTPSSGSNFVLEKTKADDLLTTVSWDKATYVGAKTAVYYDVELLTKYVNKKGQQRDTVVAVSRTTKNTIDLSVSNLNAASINAKMKPFVSQNASIRVKSSIGRNFGVPQYSTSIPVTITPYPSWPDWGLIGSYIPNTGWGSDVDMQYDSDTDTYSITLDLVDTTSDAGIKFRLDNDWKVNLGGTSLDALTKDGPNIKITESGNYTITLKVKEDAGTYTGIATIKKN